MAIQIMPTAADQVTTRDVVAANVRAEASRRRRDCPRQAIP